MVDGTHLSGNLANDEKTSCQNEFTTLRLENENPEPQYFCRYKSGTSFLSKANHLHLSFFYSFLIQVTFKLSMKTFTSIIFNPPSFKG